MSSLIQDFNLSSIVVKGQLKNRIFFLTITTKSSKLDVIKWLLNILHFMHFVCRFICIAFSKWWLMKVWLIDLETHIRLQVNTAPVHLTFPLIQVQVNISHLITGKPTIIHVLFPLYLAAQIQGLQIDTQFGMKWVCLFDIDGIESNAIHLETVEPFFKIVLMPFSSV